MTGGRPTRGQDPERRGQADGNRQQVSTRAWGAALRRARETKGWTQADLAREMGYDPSVISKLETGAVTASQQHARAADQALGLSGVFAAWLDDLINGMHEPYNRTIAELEQAATVLNIWEPCFIPGLLQTEEYMRQVFLAAGQPDARDEEIEQWVANRLARQKIRERVDPPPPMVYAVIWEPALRVSIGGPDVMHGQLKVLADAARHDRRLRVQVLPLDRGANPGMGGSFVVVDFANERPAAFLDDVLTGHSVERRGDIARLELLFATVTADAVDTRASAELIEKVADEWKP
ncbi:MAG TPA: helix-turn-helix transcriptional regulator [Streptosporangiaceae bacterium]|jgi:transcriptional regulator with XRE-family HTH domain|nr:helix-turn-helix transcriptional regulator [Streptosporangiaceae bacterium]